MTRSWDDVRAGHPVDEAAVAVHRERMLAEQEAYHADVPVRWVDLGARALHPMADGEDEAAAEIVLGAVLADQQRLMDELIAYARERRAAYNRESDDPDQRLMWTAWNSKMLGLFEAAQMLESGEVE